MPRSSKERLEAEAESRGAHCSWCGEPVVQYGPFRIFEGTDICHEGDCSDEWRLQLLDVDPKMGDPNECGKAAE